ncbi:helix-turn-helix transcriptional regulator [Vreelandella janggokensis]|uniref:helix-turn-helix transcriptional regulator n=1 Tax=Vreelandella janggokensis TaxID=370767 RepID=UPI002866E3AE|nr:helix-turn-helix transcriptional regulator [Halomonas janggokensis]MDR5884793.1 helix-turn-helix transcriptional regulator [Halomonas janggokensis]
MIDHKELGDFMKACRARLDADAMGFPVSPRRRVAGLRREEVAELANISPDWYTRLEQGRNVGVSRRVLECLSLALQLSEAETGHLFSLAGVQRPMETVMPSDERASQVDVLEALLPNPAHCVSGPWEIEAMNAAAELALPELHGNEAGGNVMRMIFRDEGFRERLVDWESHAKQCLATFRTFYGRQQARDPRFRQLVNELTLSSEAFAAWWPRQRVGDLSPASKRFIDPKLGELRFTVRFFQPTEDPSRIMTVFMGDASTQKRLGEALAR